MRRVTGILLGALLALAGPAAGAAELGFVYVEGNVGGASGGHSALRLGPRVFHFQHDGDVFRLVREDWSRFQLEYAGLQNRPLHLAEVPLAPGALSELRDHLTARHLAQLLRIARREDARLDLRLARALAGQAAELPVRAAGLLDPAAPPSARALDLRGRVEALAGAPLNVASLRDSLERHIARQLAALGRGASGAEALAVLREDLARREALRALQEGFGLAPGALLDPAEQGLPLAPLSASERAALRALAEDLPARAAALARSDRPGSGSALLLLEARWQALGASLERGRLVLLDPFPSGSAVIPEREVRRRADELGALSRQGREALERLRSGLGSSPLREAQLSLWEEVLGRSVEYARGARRGAPVRDVRGRLLPSRSRAVAVPRPGGAPSLAGLLAVARQRRERAEREVERRDGYALLERNCVTELQRALIAGLGGAERAAERLGGRLEPGEGLGFIPFVHFDQVRARYAVSRTRRIPSHRERRLAELRERDGWLGTALRESNTWTSRIYAPRDRDGSFLLFTSDVLWPRPLYGVANLGIGLVDGLTGLATAPFDHGRRLLRGARGVLFSLPELVFASVRKGSFDAATLGGARPWPPRRADLALSTQKGER